MSDREVTMPFLPRVPYRKLTGSEPLAGTDDKAVLDYWRWAHSDILQNVQRGVFAEYLVAVALDITHVPREGWAGYDLEYKGQKIEVKSGAYLQSWNQVELSKLTFRIGARQQLDETTVRYEPDPRYVADCFVFSIFGDKDPLAADLLDTYRWSFYVLAISELITVCKTAKSISEQRLRATTTSVMFQALRERIDDVLAGIRFPPALSEGAETADITTAERQKSRASRPYLVAERKTKNHPVIVNARNHQEAHLLARSDAGIASFGTQISAFELSRPQLAKALDAGATDLRPVLAEEHGTGARPDSVAGARPVSQDMPAMSTPAPTWERRGSVNSSPREPASRSSARSV